jgi:hypothetical protein
MTSRAAFLAIFICLSSNAIAQPDPIDGFCAVRVDVRRPNGNAVSRGVAELVNSNGNVVESRAVSQGSVAFCDLDFGVYSIRIHTLDGCGGTVIEGVRGIYGLPQQLKSVLNSCPGGEDGLANSCFTYVRVKFDSGAPAADVAISMTGARQLRFTDRYGRVQLAVNTGQQHDVVFSKAGFAPEHLTLNCRTPSSGVKEAYVTLKPDK